MGQKSYERVAPVSTINDTEHDRRIPLVPILILVGIVLRLWAAWRLCPGYDEVFVMGVGLIEADESWSNLWFLTPQTTSNAVTPLWWWLSAAVTTFSEFLSLAVLRLPGLLLGAVTLMLIPLLFKHWPKRTMLLILAFTAISDVLIFTNSRAEFAESLLTPCCLILISLVGRLDKNALIWQSTAAALLMMTHLGKGSTVVALFSTGTIVVLATRRPVSFRAMFVAMIPAAVGAFLTLTWMLLANAVAYQDGPIQTDIGPSANVWTSLRQLSLEYTTTKSFVMAEPLDAVQIYLDRYVWPVQSLLAWPLIVGSVIAAVPAFRKLKDQGDHLRRSLILAIWVLAGVGVVVIPGICGARFHLIYLPALWALTAIGLNVLTRWNRQALSAFFLGWICWCIVAGGWTDWRARDWSVVHGWQFSLVAAAVLVVAAVLANRRRAGGATGWLTACLIIMFASGISQIGGPMWWGQFARFEPMNQVQTDSASALAKIDHFRSGISSPPESETASLEIRLANYYLQTGNLNHAESYANRAVKLHPDDAVNWFYLALVHKANGNKHQQRTALQECLERSPESKRAKQMLRKLDTSQLQP
jgi:hypothetical protein